VASAPTAGSYLLCSIGTRACALPLTHVRETMRPLPVAPLDGVPAFVLGVAIIRGAATPVIDAARLCAAEVEGPCTRFVSLKLGVRSVALAVERVIGVRDLPQDARLVPLLQHTASGALTALTTLDQQLLLVLETARLVPDSVWRSVRALEQSV
jgi:purine-binding chemotaxis protein CheW